MKLKKQIMRLKYYSAHPHLILPRIYLYYILHNKYINKIIILTLRNLVTSKIYSFIFRRNQYIPTQNKSKKVLFVWIPKVAGTSIYSALEKHGCQKLEYPTLFHRFKNKGIVTFSHVSVTDLLSINIIGKKYWDESFKFCFVRNPWDRVVSLYHYFLKIDYINPDMSFDKFCYELYKRNFPPVGLYNSKGWSQANSQLDWITDENGNVFVDFIGRFENLEEDIKRLSDIIDLEIKLPHSNKTFHKNYRKYYTEDTKEIIRNLYREEINYFGYEF